MPLEIIEESFVGANGKTPIYMKTWSSPAKPRAIVQIVHGMVEFIDRYDELAKFLVNCGFIVVGNDHLAHGASITDESEWGDLHPSKGNDYLIADVGKVRELTQERFGSDIPYFIIGHSMGSFITRCYLSRLGAGTIQGDTPSGAIIVGTGTQPALISKGGNLLARLIATFKGSSYRSKCMNDMGIGGYNKAFEPGRTPVDWLSRNEENVDFYLNEPRCSFMFTVGGYAALTKLINECCSKNAFSSVPSNLPILMISGENDPVGDFGKGVQIPYEAFKAAGLKDITMHLYPDDRHEIFNELDRRAIYADVLAWIEAHL